MTKAPDSSRPGTDADLAPATFLARSHRLRDAMAWWEELGGGAPVAARAAKETLPGALRPSCVLMTLVDDGADFRLDVVGERVQRFTQAHLIGARASHVFGPRTTSRVIADLTAAVKERRAVLGAPGYAGHDASVAGVIHLILPLTDGDQRVTQLLVVIDFLNEPLAARPAAAAPEKRLRLAIPCAVGLLAAFLAGSVYLYGLLDTLEEERLLRQRQHLVDVVATALAALERDIGTVASLFAQRRVRDLDDFQDLNETLFGAHPGRNAIRALVLAVEVPTDEPQAFAAAVAANVAPAAARVPWPDTDRDKRLPALFVWPDPHDEGILGYDAWSNPQRRAALERTFAEGGAQASAPVILSQDAGNGPAPVSALLVHAIAGSVDLAGPGETPLRPASAAIAMGVTLNDLVLAALGSDLASLDLLVFDAGPSDDSVALADGASVTPILSRGSVVPGADLDRGGTVGYFVFAGRTIGLWMRPASIFARNLAEGVSGGLLFLGALLSVALGLFVHRAGQSRTLLERQVAQRTREIAALNSELTAKANQAIMADTAKSRLLATLSHELRTPLNGIIGFTDLLRLRFDSLPAERRRDYIDTVAEAGQHMQRVITRFLEISQDTPAAENLAIEPILLSDLDSWLEAILVPTAEKYGVTLELALSVGGVEAVMADRVALRQALMNFVDNALKFTPSGGHVRVEAAQEAEGTVLRVVDTGVGMPPARLAALEEPLAEGGSAPVNGSTGLGLGLTVSRGLLALMGFRMTVRSRVGQGTSVEVHVPASAVCMAHGAPADRGSAGRVA